MKTQQKTHHGNVIVVLLENNKDHLKWAGLYLLCLLVAIQEVLHWKYVYNKCVWNLIAGLVIHHQLRQTSY